MLDRSKILSQIKKVIEAVEPNSTVLVYGSFARGEENEQSDINLLILLDKEIVSREDEKRIKYPLYEIEFETGKIISPLVLPKTVWENKHKVTPFYENVNREGIAL